MIKKFFFTFAILGSLLLLFTGIYETNISAIGQGIGYLFFMGVIFLVISRNISFDFKAPLWLKFVFIGWFFAMIDEIVFWATNPLFENVSLIGDLTLTTGTYLLAHLGWYFVHRKYSFSWFESLITGGLALLIGEEIFGGFILASPILGIILLPAFIFMHGFHMIMPPVLLRNELNELTRKDNIYKYFFGILFPLIGYIVGAIFVFIGSLIGIK